MIQVSAVDANNVMVPEQVGTTDNVTTAKLLGTVDLAIADMALSDPTPVDGEAVQVIVFRPLHTHAFPGDEYEARK